MSTAGQGQFIIGNYRVSKTLGQGTFGKVRLGIHIPTEMKVAVKTLQKQKIVEQADIERVTRQICILKILRHPNIVQLYQIIQTKTDIHLIMQYASGGQLFDYIVKKKRLDQKQSISFMQQLLSGVDYIHKIGIVHRDLKPQNLLFDQNKRIKIVDFGLSNQYKPGQKLKTACGSPCYAAPQMIAGKKYQCLNIDIWSCGIILYAMLCGYLPFEDPNTNKLYKKIMAGDYQQPKILTMQSRDILRKMLNVNPDTRYKIQQIKDSKWYNLISQKYQTQGIIVGNDSIQSDDKLINLMKKMGVTAQTNQIRNYIANNRHNNITAFYYLLKKKTQKMPSLLNPEPKPQKEQKRSSSPLIYKPQAKSTFYVPSSSSKKIQEQKQKVNDSFNASKIVSSLVQANRSKLITNNHHKDRFKKQQNFDKVQQFKIFPKHRGSSQYQPHGQMTPVNLTTQKPPTRQQRSESQDNKTQLRGSKLGEKEIPLLKQKQQSTKQQQQQNNQNLSLSIDKKDYSYEKSRRQQSSMKNKRRQELSDQLKLISLKIDKEITQLRKHNTVTSSTITDKRRQSFTSVNNQPNINKFKIPSQAQKYNNQHNKTQQKQQPQSTKLHLYKQLPTKFPKMHFGPFNSQCLIMQAPRAIIIKISEYLNKLNIVYKQIDSFTIRLQNNEVISVQSIHGISGYHIVKFTNHNQLNQSIIELLSPS